jgi:peptidoglycan/LPS O-acetylase OafA/YrhL
MNVIFANLLNPSKPMRITGLFSNSAAMDAAHIVAATPIFYHHIGLSDHYPLSAYGEHAVQFFVIIAGVAFILYSHQSELTQANYGRYLLRRFTGLFPLFFLTNLSLYIGSFFSAPHWEDRSSFLNS